MPYLMDSDILVDSFRHTEAAANYLDSLDDWSVSGVTGLELIAGAIDKREVAEIDLVLDAYHVVPTNSEIGQLAYNIMKTHAKALHSSSRIATPQPIDEAHFSACHASIPAR